MMKAGKIFAAVAALFAATACNGNGKQNMANQQSESNVIDAKRTLIVYFSHRGVNYKQGWTERGNTEIVAGFLQSTIPLSSVHPYGGTAIHRWSRRSSTATT